MLEPKPLTHEGIDKALQKAERYRLLNEPREAESICLDVLTIDPDNQRALVALLLSITDQFGHEFGGKIDAARQILPKLDGEYQRVYYSGIICERRGKMFLRVGAPGNGPIVYDWLTQAMEWYEKAESMRPAGDDTAILRWNACARIINKYPDIRPASEESSPMELE